MRRRCDDATMPGSPNCRVRACCFGRYEPGWRACDPEVSLQWRMNDGRCNLEFSRDDGIAGLLVLSLRRCCFLSFSFEFGIQDDDFL